MSSKTSIEWTRGNDGTAGKTWNPVTGCSKVSPGCAHCYAETIAKRLWPTTYPKVLFHINGGHGVRDRQFTDVQTHEARLLEPLKWRHPSRVFVNSMSDLFHEDVPFEFIKRVWDVMAEAQRHTFQVLTKRPERMLEFTRWLAGADDISIAHWPRNVWLGVSVENQHFADERIPVLLQTPAALRFISAEPLLGPVDVGLYLSRYAMFPMPGFRDPLPRLNWVIVGGESGPRCRPTQPDWIRSIRDQCVAAGVAFFFKQWGGRTPKSGGRDLDGRTWDEYPDSLR